MRWGITAAVVAIAVAVPATSQATATARTGTVSYVVEREPASYLYTGVVQETEDLGNGTSRFTGQCQVTAYKWFLQTVHDTQARCWLLRLGTSERWHFTEASRFGSFGISYGDFIVPTSARYALCVQGVGSYRPEVAEARCEAVE